MLWTGSQTLALAVRACLTKALVWGRGFPNRWIPLLTKPGFVTLAIGSKKEDSFGVGGVKL